jgi:cyclopropane fatty-acyl-phospholipid synthase-like methyltransferase
MMQDAEFARALTVAGYNSSIAAGRKLAREFDFSPYKLFLDLGGGSGCYSIPAVQNNPDLRALVFDFSTVCTVTEEFIAKAGLTDRITTQTGDFMKDEFPVGADLVGVIGNLHAYSLDETNFVISKAFNAIKPGGGMIIIDYMLNDNKTGPLEAAFHHLGTVATSSGGYVKSTVEMTEFMKQAGAVDIAVHDFIPGSMSRVTGRKPG